MPEQWLTYRQLGEIWNTTPEAARARSRRGSYQRRMNEQGTAEVLVDVDTLTARSHRRAQGDVDWTAFVPGEDEQDTPDETALNAIRELELQVAALSRDLSKAEEQVETMRRYLAAEREQVSHLMTVLLRGEKRKGRNGGILGFLLFWRRSRQTSRLEPAQASAATPDTLRPVQAIRTEPRHLHPPAAPDMQQGARTGEQER